MEQMLIDFEPKNHHDLTEDEIHKLECLAQYRNELTQIHLAQVPDNCKSTYEWELMKPPQEYKVSDRTKRNT